MTKNLNKGIALLLAVAMVMSLCMTTVFADDPVEVHLDSLSIKGSDLKSVLKDYGFATKSTNSYNRITGPGYSQTDFSKSFTLTADGVYELETKAGITSGWSSAGSFKVILKKQSSITLKESPTFPYYPDKTIIDAEVFAAVYDSSTPTLTASDVSVEYVQYKGSMSGDKTWKKVSNRDSKPLIGVSDFHYFGEKEIEEVRVVYDGTTDYAAASATTTVTIYDPRVDTTIEPKETLEIEYDAEYANEDYEALLKDMFKVLDDEQEEIQGAEVSVKIDGTVTKPDSYNITVSYAGVKGVYKEAELKTSFTVTAPAKSYTIDVSKEGEGEVTAPELGDFTGDVSNGFTVTTTPSNGYYTEKIEIFVNDGQEAILSSQKEEKELAVGDGLFNVNDAVHVKVTFKAATIEIKSEVIEIPNTTPVTNAALAPAIFEAAYNGAEPKAVTLKPYGSDTGDVKIEFNRGTRTTDWKDDLEYTPTTGEALIGYHAFHMNDGDGQLVRLSYTYNGKLIEKTVTVKTYQAKLPTEIVAKEELKFAYCDGVTVTKANVFDAVVKSTLPDGLTADDVDVEYVCGKYLGNDYYASVDITESPGILIGEFHKFGTKETEKVRITYEENEEYQGSVLNVEVAIYDPRIETTIEPKETLELEYDAEYANEDYEALLKDMFKVLDDEQEEIQDAEVSVKIDGTVTKPDSYNITVSYAGVKGVYKEAELKTSFTVTAPAKSYTIDVSKEGEGEVTAPELGDFTGDVSNGFTVTTTPSNGYYTEKIEIFVNDGQEAILSSKKEEKELAVGDGLFNANDAVHVKVTFKPATFEIKSDVVYIPDNTPVTNAALAPAIFEAAYNGAEPKAVTLKPYGSDTGDVKVEFNRGTRTTDWRDNLEYKPTTGEALIGYHAFYMNDGDGQLVRLSYQYNGATISKTLTVKTYDHRPDTEIKVDPQEAIALTETDIYDEDAYADEIASHVSVWVKDGEEIIDAVVTVTGLTEKYDEVQTVTVSYAGDSDYKPSTTDVDVIINSTTKYTVSTSDEGDGTGTTKAPAKIIIEGDTAPGFTVTATPSSGCYLESIEVKNGDSTVFAKTKAELETIIGELSFAIPEGSFANGDVATITVNYGKADIVLHDGPIAYYTERTDEALKKATFDAIFESSTPYDVELGSAEIDRIEYDCGSLLGTKNWQSNFTHNPSLGEHEFRLDVGTSQLVRIVYKYNGETLKKEATVYGTDLRADTEIRVDSQEEVIEINECDDMKAELDKLISVAVVDGDVITDAEFTHDLDLNNFNNEQTVTINYEGTKTEYKPATKDIKVKLISDKDYVITATKISDTEIKVSFSNRTSAPVTGDVILAAYGEGDVLRAVTSEKQKSLDIGKTEFNLTIDETLSSCDNIKFFVWESMATMKPIMCAEFEVEDIGE